MKLNIANQLTTTYGNWLQGSGWEDDESVLCSNLCLSVIEHWSLSNKCMNGVVLW